MTHGRETTLIINPEGGTALTMAVTGEDPYAGTNPYLVPLNSIRIHEDARRQIVYATDSEEGGQPVGYGAALVPFEFDVLIIEDSVADRLDAFNDLQAALLNTLGGTIQFKPDAVGASALSTYYHYVKSAPPRLVADKSNRWDAGPTSDGKYVVLVTCRFMTQPIATSDPDNPETLTEMAATLENWMNASESQDNTVTISASNLKGTLPALVRILAQPGSGQCLGRLIACKRTSGDCTLANFVSIYEAEEASTIYPTVAWTEVADGDRGADGTEVEDETGASWGPEYHGLCLADGSAFFRAEGVDVTGFTDHLIKVWDSAGKLARGFILEADAAEALGAEQVQNPGFETAGGGDPDFFANWTESAGDGAIADELVVIHGGAHAAKLTAGASINTALWQNVAVTEGQLKKLTFWTAGDGTYAGRYKVRDNTAGVDIIPWTSTGVTAAVYSQLAVYVTVPSGCASISIQLACPDTDGGAAYFDDVSFKTVTHVGTDGVHIVDEVAGSTRNWEDIESGFNYNDDSYTFSIYDAGAYMKCLPAEDANTVAQGLRFTIANPGDHEGRFAVFGVGYDDAGGDEVWTHQAQVVVGSIVQEGKDTYYATVRQSWCLIYCGEFELPPTEMSDSESGYDTGPYIDWYSTRASGTSEFKLDAILLVYISDKDIDEPAAIDVVCDDEGGVVNTEELLLENFPGRHGLPMELAHVVAQSDGDLKRVLATKPRGDWIVLDPTKDNLLTFVQEQVGGNTILDDDFGDYENSRWLEVQDMEDEDDWIDVVGTSLNDAINYIENSQGIEQTTEVVANTAAAYHVFASALDLEVEGRFTDDDYCAFAFYIAAGDYANFTDLTLHLYTSAGNYFMASVLKASLASGWNFVIIKKSDFTENGSPDWASITRVYIGISASTDGVQATWDWVRFEKADPDDSTNPNATGNQWNFQPIGGHWTITEDVTGAGATLACLDVEAGVEKVALIDETTPADVKFRARCYAKRDAGYAGIVWRAGDDTLTEGAEDCYAALLDVANDVVLVREYANGAVTQHDNPAFTSAVDTWYVVGVIAKGDTFRVYATAASNLTDDDDVFDEDYLLSTVTDTTLASGNCGVMSISTLGRFDDVNLVNIREKMVPADTVTLSGKAIFRTIAPFCE